MLECNNSNNNGNNNNNNNKIGQFGFDEMRKADETPLACLGTRASEDSGHLPIELLGHPEAAGLVEKGVHLGDGTAVARRDWRGAAGGAIASINFNRAHKPASPPDEQQQPKTTQRRLTREDVPVVLPVGDRAKERWGRGGAQSHPSIMDMDANIHVSAGEGAGRTRDRRP